MTYRLLDKSIWTDENGKKQGFLHIEVNTGTDIWTVAERLPLADITTMATKGGVDAVAKAMADRAVIKRPQDKIDEANRTLLQIEQAKLDTAKEATAAEAIKLETEKVKLEVAKLATPVKP